MFLQFTEFPWKFNSPKVERNLISRIINFVCDLLQELPNNLRRKTKDLRKIGNEKKFSKLGVGIGHCPVSPAPSPTKNIKIKLPQKQISKFSGLVQFCFIFLLFANHIIDLNSSQFRSNLNILTFLITSKPLSNIYGKYKQSNLRERFKSKSFL